MTAAHKLDITARKIGRKTWGRSKPFGGAGICVCEVAPPPSEPGFYPDPVWVVTPYAYELSWVIERVRDVAMKYEQYGFFKEALFARLASCANACGSSRGVQHLLLSTLHEGYTFLTALEKEGRLIDTTDFLFGVPQGDCYDDFPFELILDFYRARNIKIELERSTSSE